MTAEHRLASYGTLAPGKLNNHQLDGLEGQWHPGTVRGRLYDSGWGSALGFPGLVLDSESFEIPVCVFESEDLPDHWERLDTFEGEGYRRVVASVLVNGQTVEAYVYALAMMPPPT
jgi:gamma-glutamylcyclotransferase (GGCT)/AIG2-like uncharacterized protein YtfP